MTNRFAAIIAAAGSGQRMGSVLPKVLLDLGGISVLCKTVETFLSISVFEKIVVLIKEDERALFEKELVGYPSIDLVAGGASRQESVFNALRYLQRHYSNEEQGFLYVAIHDAARCFVNPQTINKGIEAVLEHQAVTTAVPLVDSIKRVSAQFLVTESLDREGLFAVQTPQLFKFSLIFKAHQESCCQATDDASLVERLHPVKVIEGDRLNFKITSPVDYQIARALFADKPRANHF